MNTISKTTCLGFTLFLSSVFYAPYSLGSESFITSQWLTSLGDKVPDNHNLPDGFKIIPVGLKYETIQKAVPLKRVERRAPNVYRTVIKNIIVSPERTETVITPATVDRDGNILKPEQVRIVTHPQIMEQVTSREIVKLGKSYEALIQDIPKYKISRKVTGIRGYSLVDHDQNVVRSWIYSDGKLKLDGTKK